MSRIKNFIQRLSQKEIIILDGAMGTELLRRGIETRLPLWSATALVEAPEAVQAIHLDYINSGADVVTTNTFRTNVRVVEYDGSPYTSVDLTKKAAELALLAREESGRTEVVVAGGLAPVEDCYCPELVPTREELLREHLVVANALQEAGVDFIFSETMNCVRESLATAEVAREVGLPLAMSFVCSEDGRLLSGETLADVVTQLLPFQPLFLAVNCKPPEQTIVSLKSLLACAQDYNTPVGVYANGEGNPDDTDGWSFPDGLGVAADRYLQHANEWKTLGATVIGGCCGTTPEYVKVLAENI